MRYLLLSDVHANAVALAATLRHAESRRWHKVIFLGDAVGYYPDGDRVLGHARHGATFTGRSQTNTRSYMRYLRTISPPMPSIARFMGLFVSRIQPISPPFCGVRSAESKCIW